MALTNFAALTSEQKTVWSRDFWHAARNASFINQFAGSGSNAMVQRITDLTKSEKGARAVLTLLADLSGDGVVGDYTLEGNEEALSSSDITVRIDQMRNANRLAGRLADQKSIVNFREASKDSLAYWMADRMDQIAFLTLSGLAYTKKNNGGARTVAATGQNLSNLEFSADVSAPTSARTLVAKADGTVGTGNLLATGILGYKNIVNLKAYAKDHYMRGVRGKGGDEGFHMFVTPQGMAQLKLDADFLANVRNAGNRGPVNSLFSGSSSVMVDGVMVHEFRHVYDTSGEASDGKFGAGGAINGQRALFCGAQALAMADIGDADWVEDTYDYGNQHGISIGKILGFRKPKYTSMVTGDAQDFGVITLDTAL